MRHHAGATEQGCGEIPRPDGARSDGEAPREDRATGERARCALAGFTTRWAGALSVAARSLGECRISQVPDRFFSGSSGFREGAADSESLGQWFESTHQRQRERRPGSPLLFVPPRKEPNSPLERYVLPIRARYLDITERLRAARRPPSNEREYEVGQCIWRRAKPNPRSASAISASVPGSGTPCTWPLRT